MFAYPLIHDLVAGSGEEKAEAEELVDSIVGMSLPLLLHSWNLNSFHHNLGGVATHIFAI